jgi:serine/threonine protein kinase
VRTFRTGEDGKPDNVKPLPYDLVPASESLDLWSVGILAYLLCAAKPLVSSTRDDDFESGNAMSVIATWGREKMKKKLQAVPDDVARDLIQTLLQPDPSDRRTVDDALKHPFFHPESHDSKVKAALDEIKQGQEEIKQEQKKHTAYLDKINKRTKMIDQRTVEIVGLQRRTMVQMTEQSTSLRLCIQAAADDTVPTAFIIVPTPPDPSTLDELVEAGEDAAGAAHALSEKPNARRVAKLASSIKTLYEVTSDVASTAQKAFDDPARFIAGKLKECATVSFDLHLVCEVGSSVTWRIRIAPLNH